MVRVQGRKGEVDNKMVHMDHIRNILCTNSDSVDSGQFIEILNTMEISC